MSLLTQTNDQTWEVLVPEKVMDQVFSYLADKIADYIQQSKLPVKVAVVTTGGIYVWGRIDDILARRHSEIIERYSYHVVDVNSYGGGEKAGYLDMRLDRLGTLEGHNVVIVDDIFDTGGTVNFLSRYCLYCRYANEVKIATMLLKEGKKASRVQVDPDWFGVQVIDVFVAGCGLDGGEAFGWTRSMSDIRYNAQKHPNMPARDRWYTTAWEEVVQLS